MKREERIRQSIQEWLISNLLDNLQNIWGDMVYFTQSEIFGVILSISISLFPKFYLVHTLHHLFIKEAYSEPCQATKMEHFAKRNNILKPLTIFAKRSILHVSQGSEYASSYISMRHCGPLILYFEVTCQQLFSSFCNAFAYNLIKYQKAQRISSVLNEEN